MNKKNYSPINILKEKVHIEFDGNEKVIIDECDGILEYTTQQVRVKTRGFILRFQGRNLHICNMTLNSIILNGYIEKLEFLF